MVQSIDQALITEFSALVHQVAQQKAARLKPHVQIKQMSGDLWAYDGLGSVEAREIEGRVVKADFDDIEHNRRKLSRRRFIINLPVDASDVRGSLLNVDSEYAEACANGMVRQMDRVMAGAAFADVLTGRDFETTVTATADGVVAVDATAGLTYEKLLEINQNFIDEDVGTDMNESLYLTITGKENTQLMQETELTSGDFTRELSVDKGKMVFAAGMNLIHFAANRPQPILAVESAQRKLIAASSRGICLGISKDMSITIQERNDLVETHQVQIVMEIGAVRTEGALIQEVSTTA